MPAVTSMLRKRCLPSVELGTFFLVVCQIFFLVLAAISAIGALLGILSSRFPAELSTLVLVKEQVIPIFKAREREAHPDHRTTRSDELLVLIDKCDHFLTKSSDTYLFWAQRCICDVKIVRSAVANSFPWYTREVHRAVVRAWKSGRALCGEVMVSLSVQ